MANKKKNFTYLFDDGEVTMPSSYQAKCNVTGEIIPIYHKFLQKMVENKYKNNWAYFLKHFKKKGADEQVREEAGIPGEPEEQKLNEYSKYLAICWRTETDRLLEPDISEEQKVKSIREIDRCVELYTKRFKRKISDDVNAIAAAK